MISANYIIVMTYCALLELKLLYILQLYYLFRSVWNLQIKQIEYYNIGTTNDTKHN